MEGFATKTSKGGFVVAAVIKSQVFSLYPKHLKWTSEMELIYKNP